MIQIKKNVGFQIVREKGIESKVISSINNKSQIKKGTDSMNLNINKYNISMIKNTKKQKDKRGDDFGVGINNKKKQSQKHQYLKAEYQPRKIMPKDPHKPKNIKEQKDKKEKKTKTETKEVKLTQYLRDKYLSPSSKLPEQNILDLKQSNGGDPYDQRFKADINFQQIKFKRYQRQEEKRKFPKQTSKEFHTLRSTSPFIKQNQKNSSKLKKAGSEHNLHYLIHHPRTPIKKFSNKTGSKLLQSNQLTNSDSICKSTPRRPQRYQKFAFRSQKYIQMSSDLKQMRSSSATNSDQTQNSKVSSIKNIPATYDSQNLLSKHQKLQNQIKYYKQMIARSEKTLTVMNSALLESTKKVTEQRKRYQEQIKDLKEKIQSNQMRNNLGHIFSYKDFDMEMLIPQDIIVDKEDQGQEDQSFESLKKRGEMIMEYYERFLGRKNSLISEDGLSVNSRQ